MGPIPGVIDQGAKMISAIGSILKVDEEKNLSEADYEKLIDKIKDPVGTFYMYGLAASIINRRQK
jgi:F420-non-reducing hydrogenase small subunit